MYPRNNASPEPIAIGAVIQISDGAVQTSGCTVRIRPIGVSEGAGAGTIAYTTDGVVMYTPTQAETNYTSFVLIASKSGCVPVAVTVVTTDAATPGRVRLDGVTHSGATVPAVTTTTNLTNLPSIPANWLTAAGLAADAVTEIQSGLATAASQTSIETKIDTIDGIVDAILVDTDSTIPATLTIIAGYIDTEITDIRNRLPATLDSGRMRVVVESINANVVNASALAADAVTEIQSGLSTLDAAGVRSAVGLASANLDTQLTSIKDDATDILTVANKLDTAIEVDGLVWRFTVNALENAPSGGGGGSGDASQATLLLVKAKTDLITSQSVFVTVDRVSGSTITMYYNESTSVTVPIDENTTGLTLRFVVENADGLDVLVIETASITRTSTNFTVTITTAVTATLGQYKWALRDITGGINRLVEGGVLQVQPAANRDA